ncbi:DUF4386 domain-containing protein [Dyella choica]|uniref:DUF4386 domain-containing protein n=1 Tax=Dyella choica TaxID=1927959 RepID=A0A432M7L1_9GAMM|nr:DUF4386 domain-containing protein [Dyella choica]RUL77494.1 DUF4386 domain-containing protein [Dyella choica]
MDSMAKTARLAGLLYVIVVVTGIFSLQYVPSHIIVSGDVTATFNHLVASESLFRAGIAVNVISHVAFVLLPLALYKLLSPVNRSAAAAMVALALVSVPMDLLAVAYQLDILTLLHDDTYRQALTANPLHSMVQASLDAFDDRITLAEMFWGLWLFPFGYLVFRSGFLPRLLGVLLMLGCFSYLILFFAQVLRPGYDVPGFVMLPAACGEIGIALWLLIVGVGRKATASR